jgi:hypothetical protein
MNLESIKKYIESKLEKTQWVENELSELAYIFSK